MNDLPASIDRTIRSRRLFRAGQPVLVAVSGGLDSMVLLAILQQLSQRTAWQLTVAHLNHQLRGRSSDADERLVRRRARELGLTAVVERANVRSLAWAQKLSLEMAAREARHSFLARTAVQLAIPSVALAHHADDQLELFFLRLLRGSGSEGLAGMTWRGASPVNPAVQLVRPLLDHPKAALREYALQRAICFREDASNACLDFQRNRLRHELLPLLKRHYQPALERTVLRAMDILGAEAEFVNATAAQWLRRRIGAPFERLPVALQRRVVQLQLFRHGIVPDFDLVEHLRMNPEQRASAPGAKGVSVLREGLGRVRVERAAALTFREGSVEVELSGLAGKTAFDQVNFAWRVEPRKGDHRAPTVPGCEFLDADKVGTSICLRHWQPGDRFRPIGMNSRVKLQDLFVNQRVTSTRRRELILATTRGGEVFWVEGLRLSERFKLTPGTIRRLHWCWQRL